MKDFLTRLGAAIAGTVLAFGAFTPLANATFLVPQGGTGVQTAAAHGVIVGNGVNPFNVVSPGTSGYVLTSNGASADPTFQSLTAAFSATAPITLTAGVIAIVKADSTHDGYLSSADWNTFNNKGSGTVTSVATNNGLTGGTITTTGTIGLATISANSVLGNITGVSAVPTSLATSSLFNNAGAASSGLLTSTDWNTFNGKISANQTITLSGDISGSGSTAITTAIGANKVTVGMLAQAAANTILGNKTGATGNITAFATSTLGIALSDTTGTLAVGRGGTGLASFTADQIFYSNHAGTGLLQVATSSLSGTSITVGGSGAVVGGAGLTVNLNLSNANAWTALQSFSLASSTLFSNFGKAYFGGTATTTIDSAGNIVIPSGSSLTNTGRSDGCATWSSGVIVSAGAPCGTSSGSVTSITASTPNSTLTLGGTNPVTTSGTIQFDLNLGHSNIWTVLQSFANASSSLSSHTGTAWFGATASTTINADGAGSIVLASTGNITLGGRGVAAGSFVAFDPNGKLIATTTPSSGGTPGGSSGQVQFNNTTFGGDSLFFWDNVKKFLGIGSSTPAATLAVQDSNTLSVASSSIWTGTGTYTYAVPAGAAFATVQLWGGGGGGGFNIGGGSGGGGGAGAYVASTTFSFAATTSVQIVVAGGGGNSGGGSGYQAGTSSGAPSGSGGGGGGSSAFGSLCAAGGGGGGSGSGNGGGQAASGTTGGSGGSGGGSGGAGGGGGSAATGGCASATGTGGNGSGNGGAGGSSAGVSGNGNNAVTSTGGLGSGGASQGANGITGSGNTGGGGNAGSNGGNGGSPGAGAGGATGGGGGTGGSGAVIITAYSYATSTPLADFDISGLNRDAFQINDEGDSIFGSTINSIKYISFEIEKFGHEIFGGPTPSVTSCGSSPSVIGNDTTGVITTGSGSPTACTLNFANGFSSTGVVCVGDTSGAIYVETSSVGASAWNMTLSASLSSGKIYYRCGGYQ